MRKNHQRTHLEQTFTLLLPRDRFSEILDEKEYWAFVSQMAEIIQPEGVDMFQMDMVHIHAVLKNRSFDVESLMRQVRPARVSAAAGARSNAPSKRISTMSS